MISTVLCSLSTTNNSIQIKAQLYFSTKLFDVQLQTLVCKGTGKTPYKQMDFSRCVANKIRHERFEVIAIARHQANPPKLCDLIC